MSGDARAPDGLFPRSLAAFLVALDVGVALHLVRHLARMIAQIFLPPRRFFFVLAAARLVDLGPRRHLSGVERNLVVVLRAAFAGALAPPPSKLSRMFAIPPASFARAFEESAGCTRRAASCARCRPDDAADDADGLPAGMDGVRDGARRRAVS